METTTEKFLLVEQPVESCILALHHNHSEDCYRGPFETLLVPPKFAPLNSLITPILNQLFDAIRAILVIFPESESLSAEKRDEKIIITFYRFFAHVHCPSGTP